MGQPLIAPDKLAISLHRVKVFDVRWRLGDPGYGAAAYRAGHVPGAVHVDLDTDLSSKPGPEGRHPLPDPEEFRQTLERLGISPDDSVVVYDDAGGVVAARMWWMLRSIGHHDSSVINGGMQAWSGTGLPVSTIPRTPERATYPGPVEFTGVVGIDDLNSRSLVDVRAAERYRGEIEPVDPRPGHIPGAVNIPTDEALVGVEFADSEALAALYGELTRPVFSCGSGVNACHGALAMMASGFPTPDVFIGSYSQWSRSDRPVVTGPDPF